MNKKDLRKDTLIKVAVIIAIIVVINIISNRVFTRLDLTKNKSYTLSTISKTIVGNLDDKLIVKAYFSENLPAPYNTLRRQIQDMLDDYRSYSSGNLNYEFLNPTGEGEDSELEKEAQKYGIQPVQIQVIDNDKLEVKKAFLGLVFLYRGKQESIPVIQSTNTLEYDITSTIKRLMTDTKKKIGFLTGHGETDINKMQNISNALSSQYEIRSVDVSLNKPVPDDIDVLVFFGTKSPIPENQKYLIDQFIMRGGNVALMLNKVVPNFQQQVIIGDQLNVNLDDMFQHYGIKINNDLIRDMNCSAVQVPSQIGIPISVSYPYFPLVTNINRDIAAFKNIQSVTLSFVSSIDLNAVQGKEVSVKPLLTTSDKSGKAEGFYILNLEQFQNLTKKSADSMFNSKGFVVGAVYEGKFKSFYEGKTPVTDTAQGSSPLTLQQLNESQKESRMIVIGDADFANEEARPPRDNITFFINMIDYLADDIGLTEIRGRELSEAPIGDVSDATKKVIKYVNLIIPPVIVLLVGLFIWNRRKTKKKNLQSV